MNIEEMSIEELEELEKELKVEYFDIEMRKSGIMQDISVIEARKQSLMNQNENSIENSVEINSQEEEKQEEVEPEVVLPDTTEEVILPQAEEVEEKETEIVQVPSAPVDEQVVNQDVVNPQELNQEPLIPVGIEIPNAEVKDVEKKVFVKTDVNEPKAIMVTAEQSQKLRKSKETNNGGVFENIEIIPNSTNSIEIVPNEQQVAETPEQIEQQMSAMMNELATTTDENRANEINNKLAELNEKKKQFVKVA